MLVVVELREVGAYGEARYQSYGVFVQRLGKIRSELCSSESEREDSGGGQQEGTITCALCFLFHTITISSLPLPSPPTQSRIHLIISS